LDAFLATGAEVGEALGLAAVVHGRDAVLPLLAEALACGPSQHLPEVAIQILKGVASADPAFAQAGLEVWLGAHDNRLRGRGRLDLSGQAWVTNLPAGLGVDQLLSLGGTSIRALPERLHVGRLTLIGSQVASLPDSLWVDGWLDIGDAPVVHLPKGLVVDRLDLRDCVTWDGIIPEDALVGAAVWSDEHPLGIELPAWRALHPNGERA
jgi:hypothetical protein